MIIKTLVENTSISKDLGNEHGLSLYIEMMDCKILFDVGASSLFVENAKKLEVDISDIGFLVISHGHYDHGGGLKAFLKENNSSTVYVHKKAFDKNHALRDNGELEYIGLEESLKQNAQIVFTNNHFIISKGIEMFSNTAKRYLSPASNRGLLTERNGQIANDSFAHEQNLIIEEDGKLLLVTGCAHNGIINILDHFYTLKKRMPDYVIGGFHLSSSSYGNESFENIDKIGKYLLETKAKYYTCHCTGLEPYNRLKTILGKNIDYLKTGSEITI
jgi:7,8-dihydropterin-6-yl-methyl-4-(beta-D-ribofuranosyl)aminobenzene 5'-phosphate synthase